MDTTKIDQFIEQLLGSGAIRGLPVIEKEESILAFLSLNEQKLRSTFASPDYYPAEKWESVKFELLKKTGEKIAGLLRPRLENIVRKSIQHLFTFPDPDTPYREMLLSLVGKLLSKYQSRRIYANIVNFIEQDKLQPFIDNIYEKKRTIYRGLSGFDAINLKNAPDAIDFTFTTFMILPLFDISLPMKVLNPQSSSMQAVAFRDMEGNASLRASFISKVREIIQKGLGDISPDYLDILARTFYDFDEQENAPFTSKFSKILYNIILEYRAIKADKGADSYEASWLAVARTNYKFYAYDFAILDELYKITIEEGI